MKKLLLLVFCCFSFVLANAQSMTGTYSTSRGEYGNVLSGNAPSYIKGNNKLYVNAPYLANIVKHEWTLRSGPSGSRIETTNNQSVTAIVGNANSGFYVLDYVATDSSGKVYNGNYYFCIQGF